MAKGDVREGKMADVLLEGLDDGVLTLTMNRPDRLNALNPEMLARLHDALERAAGDHEVAVIVLAGAGRAFCAGGDVKAMAEGRSESFDERARGLRQRMEAARLLHEIPKPTIAMLRGAAAGAGLSLALACDLRVASDTARLTTAFAKVALSGDFGGSYFLTHLVGPAKARELYFTSPILSGAEAQARGPRVTLGYMKQNMNLAERAGLADVMDAEALRHTRCGQTEDHREAATAFVEKRAPSFKGR